MYKGKALRHTSLRLSIEICVFAVSFYQIIKAVLPLETDNTKLNHLLFFQELDVEGTSRKRRKRKKHKEHRRDKGTLKVMALISLDQWFVTDVPIILFLTRNSLSISRKTVEIPESGQLSVAASQVNL